MILPKFESHHFDLAIWRYKIHKTAFKSANLNYPTAKLSLTHGTRVSAGPAYQRDENRGGARDGVATAKLADGGSSGKTYGTGVLPTTMRTHSCPHFNLYRTLARMTACMADDGVVRRCSDEVRPCGTRLSSI